MATLSRHNGGYQVANVKKYDVWGKVRSDSGTGTSGQILNPTQRYCGNLGHKFDSTSGLVYMRARYYEAETGRFISEDPKMEGGNWYSYCKNSPSLYVDESGASALDVTKALLQALLFIGGEILMDMWTCASSQVYKLTKWMNELESLLKVGNKLGGDVKDLVELRKELAESSRMLQRAKFIKSGQTLLKLIGYTMIIKAFLMDIDFGDGQSGLDIIFGGD